MPDLLVPVERKIELPTLQRVGDILPESFNRETRTMEVVWSTGFRGLRRMWFGDDFYEELSMDPRHVRLDALRSGRAPFLAIHNGYSLGATLGVIESARVEGGKGFATVRWSRRDDDELRKVMQDVEDGILRNISCGYRIYRMEQLKEREKDDLKVYRAVDWEPKEVSLVPMGFDPGAQVRSADDSRQESTTQCVFIDFGRSQGEGSEMPKENAVQDPPTGGGGGDETRAAEERQRAEQAERKRVSEAEERGRRAERERVEGIRTRCASLGLEDEAASDMISRGLDGQELADAMLDAVAKKTNATRTDSHIEAGASEIDKVRAAMTEALEHRVGLTSELKDPGARSFRGMQLIRMGEELLGRMGHKFASMAPIDIARDLLGAQGTGAFPKLLENIANKVLLKTHMAKPPTWLPISRKSTARDFKDMSRVRISDLDKLLPLNEHGEVERGTVGEEGEKYRVKTYARTYALTREALVNDDTSAFDRIPRGVAAVVARNRSDLVWSLLTGNVVMADGNALFSGAHSNDLGASNALSVSSLKLARALLRNQTTIKGEAMNLEMATLIVRVDDETTAEEILAPISATTVGEVNRFKDILTSIIVEPRLNGTAAWYLAASMDAVDLFEYATLTESGAPLLESREGFNTLGVEWRIVDDFGVTPLDYRGFLRANV